MLEPFEVVIPEDNLAPNNENFTNKYKPISTDLGRNIRQIDCPLRREVDRIKTILKFFAHENKIAF